MMAINIKLLLNLEHQLELLLNGKMEREGDILLFYTMLMHNYSCLKISLNKESRFCKE